MTIEALLIAGAIFGLLAAVLVPNAGLGCVSLSAIPAAMIIFVMVDQRLHPENVSSTSALTFLFAPLWPSLGALVGYAVGRLLRFSITQVRKRIGS